MNPTDAHRKEQRKKEIARNKTERKYHRDAYGKMEKPEELKKELAEVLDQEEQGVKSLSLRLKKKVLQDAYDLSLKRKKVSTQSSAHM